MTDALREAAWGRSNWKEASQRLAVALPGTMASFVNYDLPNSSINAVFEHGFAPEFVASYLSHYASVNPWMDFWATAPSGRVAVSERESPAHAFRDSEFYTDWLAPQGNADAAVGMRLRVDTRNTIDVVWHYGVARAAQYDLPAAAILEAVKPGIEEAVIGATLLKSGLEQGLGIGGILEHIDGIAVMVDRDRRIREANTEAILAMQGGELVSGLEGIVTMRDQVAQRWLEDAVARLLDGLPTASVTATFSVGAGVVKVSLTRAPHHTGVSPMLLVPPTPQVLLVVKTLLGRPVRMDVGDLHVAFGLSSAETRLCEMLVNGLSLSEAAKQLGISEGTVRQRIKMIFNKTGTHRQGELVALLARFRISG